MQNPALAIGDTVRIIKADFSNQTWLEGAEFPVQEEHRKDSPYLLVPGVGSCYCQWEPIDPEIVALNEEIDKLRELNRVQMERITTLVNDVRHNSDVLTTAFRTQKSERGWCDTANSVAREISDQFRGGLVIETEEEFEVTITVRAYFEYEHNTTVMANSQDEANELVEDDPSQFVDEYSLNDAHSYEGWTNIEYELY